MKSEITSSSSRRELRLVDAILCRHYKPGHDEEVDAIAVILVGVDKNLPNSPYHVLWFFPSSESTTGYMTKSNAEAFVIIPFEEGDQFIQTF